METLVQFAQFEIWFLLGGLALLIGYQMLTGKINMQGLLDDKAAGGLSPGRVQLLVLTLAGAGYYLLLVAQQPPDASLLPMSAGRGWQTGGEG